MAKRVGEFVLKAVQAYLWAVRNVMVRIAPVEPVYNLLMGLFWCPVVFGCMLLVAVPWFYLCHRLGLHSTRLASVLGMALLWLLLAVAERRMRGRRERPPDEVTGIQPAGADDPLCPRHL